MTLRFSSIGILLLALSVVVHASELSVPELDHRYTCVVFRHMVAVPSFLHSAKLSSEDEQAASKIIGDAVRQIDLLAKAVDDHLLAERDAFVLRNHLLEQARGQLDNRLSQHGWLRLTTFIQMEVINLIRSADQPRVQVTV